MESLAENEDEHINNNNNKIINIQYSSGSVPGSKLGVRQQQARVTSLVLCQYKLLLNYNVLESHSL